jgi:hypothetical protein
MRDVRKLEARATGRIARKRNGEPAHRTVHHPGYRKQARRLAARDLSAGIALELIVAAKTQIARNRQEPARNALGVRQGVPHVLDRRVIGTRGDDNTGKPSFVLTTVDLPNDRTDIAGNITFHGRPPSVPATRD